MKVRQAEESDYDQLMKLYNEFVGEDRYSEHNYDSYFKVIKSPTNFVFVAEEDGNIIGFISFSIRNVIRYPKPIAELDELYIDPAHRKKGLGKQLMKTVEEKAKELDCHRMYIETNYRFKEAHAFYEATGYTNYGYHFLKNL